MPFGCNGPATGSGFSSRVNLLVPMECAGTGLASPCSYFLRSTRAVPRSLVCSAKLYGAAQLRLHSGRVSGQAATAFLALMTSNPASSLYSHRTAPDHQFTPLRPECGLHSEPQPWCRLQHCCESVLAAWYSSSPVKNTRSSRCFSLRCPLFGNRHAQPAGRWSRRLPWSAVRSMPVRAQFAHTHAPLAAEPMRCKP
jgi:hypothetical protein